MAKTAIGQPSARDLISAGADLHDLTRAAQECRGCDIWKRATQAVMGEGATEAAVMFVGEQPGNSEDLEGHPFVGPAGSILSKALSEAGIDRSKVYITNVVKHFNSTRRGKLRIHKRPNAEQIAACRPWLEAEISAGPAQGAGLSRRDGGASFDRQRFPCIAPTRRSNVIRAGSLHRGDGASFVDIALARLRSSACGDA